MPPHPASGAVLLLIDLQKAIDHPDWGERNNPQADGNLIKLLGLWRSSGWPVWHVRHDSREAHSHYRLGQPGNDFRPDTAPLPDEKVIAKLTNCAFIGTTLDPDLRARGDTRLVVAGVITNNSVEATVRMAGNLGYETYLVEDACFTFGRADHRGVQRTAEDVHSMSLANLDGEYCHVVTTHELFASG